MIDHSIKTFFLFVILLSVACTNKPKVVSSSNNNTETERTSGIFENSTNSDKHVHDNPSISDGMHTVVAKKVLPTLKYVYVLVEEEGEEYWIAANKQDIHIGATYFYRGGLLKTNFESKEHNRTFEKIYLVSKLVHSTHGNSAEPKIKTSSSVSNKIDIKGSIKIAELVDNAEKYSGKTIQVSGECVKINPNIMGRNWIHLKDGSKDDFDFVVTSNIAVPIGHKVTMTGIVVLDKDFGAGYKYDILVENGQIVK